jgi:hypothetical protein
MDIHITSKGSIYLGGYDRGNPIKGTMKSFCGIYDSTGIKKWFMCDGYYSTHYFEDKNLVVFKGKELSASNASIEERAKYIQYNKKIKLLVVNF